MQTKCAPEENVHGLWNNSTSANVKENEIEINITNASGKANSMECESIFGLCFSHTTTKLQLDELKDLRVVCLLSFMHNKRYISKHDLPFLTHKTPIHFTNTWACEAVWNWCMNARKSEQEKPITINTHRTHGATLPHTHTHTHSAFVYTNIPMLTMCA